MATDDLGAASEPTPAPLDFGPGVDAKPTCEPTMSSTPDDPVDFRPGAPRRLGVACRDSDGDPITPSLRIAPPRGSRPRTRRST